MAAREDGRQSAGSWAVRLRMGEGGPDLWARYEAAAKAAGYPDRSAALRAHIQGVVDRYERDRRDEQRLWTTGDPVNEM